MRSLVVALALFTAAPVLAQQADDDERPGAENAPKTRLSNDTPVQTDTPTFEGDDHAPVTRSTKKLKRGKGGDSPINLSDDAAKANPEGNYAGVTIGGEGLPPHPPKLPVKGPQRMTWPGFQVRDGVPTVFLQTTGTPNYSIAPAKGGYTVTLRDTKINVRNNKRPLKIAEFGTAVTEVSAKPHGRDVIVTIKTKGEVSHRERVEPSAGGYQLLVVELPGK